jgi:NAD(P)-dependent dehydrogenase (short-subunit alcohol dehydrogenase family)
MTVTDITPVVLITGPTRGLGKDLALALARRRCRLILLGRTASELDKTAAAVSGAGAVGSHQVVLDLASFTSIRESAQQVQRFLSSEGIPGIDAVVANAGIQMGDRLHTTNDGLETTFGVNVVGNHLLLNLLRPMLSPSAHVVVVGSGTHFGDPITKLVVAAPRWEEPHELAQAGGADANAAKSGQRAYSTSKLAVNYLVHELNRRWGSSVRANIYDPGLMPGTGLARDLPPMKQWAWNNIMPALKVLPGVSSTANSAERLARLVLAEEHGTAVNEYFEIGKLSKASVESKNPGRESALWQFCEQVTNHS